METHPHSLIYLFTKRTWIDHTWVVCPFMKAQNEWSLMKLCFDNEKQSSSHTQHTHQGQRRYFLFEFIMSVWNILLAFERAWQKPIWNVVYMRSSRVQNPLRLWLKRHLSWGNETLRWAYLLRIWATKKKKWPSLP